VHDTVRVCILTMVAPRQVGMHWFFPQLSPRSLLAAALVGVCLLLPGCAFLEPEDPNYEDPKPWNAPAGWERSVIGVPM